jgi:sortase A
LNKRKLNLNRVERYLLFAGVILLGVYVSALVHRAVSSRLALWEFDTAVAQKSASAHELDERVDFSLWAEKRIRAYRDSLVTKTDPPLAVLEIAKLKIRVPVFDGTDDLTLNRGVGRIIGSARVGSQGNIGIAGHRDGFFRGLKDIAVGEQINLMTANEDAMYVVDQIEIVTPTDVHVLQPRSTPSITLITCYPFYFVGDAPNRFVVHASLGSGRKNNKTEASISTSIITKESTK